MKEPELSINCHTCVFLVMLVSLAASDDLDLCWDPLEAFSLAMTVAAKQLGTSQPDFGFQEASNQSSGCCQICEEEFQSEKFQTDEESMLSPTIPLHTKDDDSDAAPGLPSDIPDLDLNAGKSVGHVCWPLLSILHIWALN